MGKTVKFGDIYKDKSVHTRKAKKGHSRVVEIENWDSTAYATKNSHKKYENRLITNIETREDRISLMKHLDKATSKIGVKFRELMNSVEFENRNSLWCDIMHTIELADIDTGKDFLDLKRQLIDRRYNKLKLQSRKHILNGDFHKLINVEKQTYEIKTKEVLSIVGQRYI